MSGGCVIEQCERVAQQHSMVDIAGRKNAPPDVLGGEREHREADQRDDEQAGVEIGADRAALLRFDERACEQLRDLRCNDLVQHVAQRPFLVDDLADPQ